MRIAIIGAGSIGCYVGGRLTAAGAQVHFVGRESIGAMLAAHGLRLSDYRGASLRIAAGSVSFSTTLGSARDCDVFLITVKSAATAEVAQGLAAVVPDRGLVVSLQNGLGNAAVLREYLPRATVLPGMVPFNVVNAGQGRFHQGSEGDLEVEDHPDLAGLKPAFAAAGLPLVSHPDLLPVLWAKLLLNLNNPVNALSGLPLKAELSQRAFRCCVALAQREALHWMDIAGIQPARLTPLPPHWIPRLLAVPDWLFRLLANKMLEIDPLARSSMWEDLEAGRHTEIDWINGEVLRLARRHGGTAPVNARLIALIRDAEAGDRHEWRGEDLLRELQQAALF